MYQKRQIVCRIDGFEINFQCCAFNVSTKHWLTIQGLPTSKEETNIEYAAINVEYTTKKIFKMSYSTVHIRPSHNLKEYICKIKSSENTTLGIKNLISINKVTEAVMEHEKVHGTISADEKKVPDLPSGKSFFSTLSSPTISTHRDDDMLNISDLQWLNDYLRQENKSKHNKVYIHELLECSDIILPESEKVTRNPILELRCQKLKEEQDNRLYNEMTANVDISRKKHTNESIGYQLQQLDKHLVAVFQFVLSVLCGFVFGFVGIELIVGDIDVGTRLLLGIVCAVFIALAELYFLAKYFDTDFQDKQLQKK